MTTFYASYPPIPKTTLDLIERNRDDEALPLLDERAKNDTNAHGGLQNGVWVYGVDSAAEYVAKPPTTPSASTRFAASEHLCSFWKARRTRCSTGRQTL